MSRRGVYLYASSIDPFWPSLLALQPRALVLRDSNHLPVEGLPPEKQLHFCFHPWVPGEWQGNTPEQWVDFVYSEWIEKGSRPFHSMLPWNEPNLPDGSLECARAFSAWAQKLIPLLREKWGPNLWLHSPPLSPNVPGWEEYYVALDEIVRLCKYLDVHTYLDKRDSYAVPAALWPDKPIVISECGDGQWGSEEYGRALLAWFAGLPERVEWAAIFAFNSTDGLWPDWELYHQPACKVLIEAGR